ncbi:MAG: hypothetical protein RLZZ330_1024 [Actinomycetota bacterium]|jgi:proteasome accessory factor C
MNRFERLLTMVPWLSQHQGISHQEVADHFEITLEQTIQDLMLLSVTGVGQYANQQFDVDYTGNKVRINDPLGLDKPFSLDSTEAACLLLGLDSLAQLPVQVTGFESEEIENLRNRIAKAVPLSEGVEVLPEELQESEIHSLIANAIAEQKQISFDYWNDGRDDVIRRTVSPSRLYTINQKSRVDALEHGKGWRSFRLENIDSLVVEKTDAVFDLPYEPMKTTEVEIEVPVAHMHVLENFTVVKRRKATKTLVVATVRVNDPRWLSRQILATGCAIKILSPNEISIKVDDYISQARSAYPKKNNSK